MLVNCNALLTSLNRSPGGILARLAGDQLIMWEQVAWLCAATAELKPLEIQSVLFPSVQF